MLSRVIVNTWATYLTDKASTEAISSTKLTNFILLYEMYSSNSSNYQDQCAFWGIDVSLCGVQQCVVGGLDLVFEVRNIFI
jgi:hypothetical protein